MGWTPQNQLPPGYVIEGTQPPATFAAGLVLFMPFLPLTLANLNLMMFGAFGLGPLQFDAKVQLNAALGVSLAWNPAAAITANAQVGLSLANLIPNFSVNASLQADLMLKIGGIQLLLNLGLKLTFQLPPLIASINAFFNLPSCYFAIYNGPPGGMKSLAASLPGAPFAAAMLIGAGYPSVAAGASFVTAVGGLFTTSP